jgi:hypothetical protein
LRGGGKGQEGQKSAGHDREKPAPDAFERHRLPPHYVFTECTMYRGGSHIT